MAGVAETVGMGEVNTMTVEEIMIVTKDMSNAIRQGSIPATPVGLLVGWMRITEAHT